MSEKVELTKGPIEENCIDSHLGKKGLHSGSRQKNGKAVNSSFLVESLV